MSAEIPPKQPGRTNPENHFETRTTAHAAALLAAGLSLSGYRRDGDSVWFELSDPERAPALLAAYVSGALTVDARKLLDCLAALRDLVRAAKGGAAR